MHLARQGLQRADSQRLLGGSAVRHGIRFLPTLGLAKKGECGPDDVSALLM